MSKAASSTYKLQPANTRSSCDLKAFASPATSMHTLFSPKNLDMTEIWKISMHTREETRTEWLEDELLVPAEPSGLKNVEKMPDKHGAALT